MPRLRRSATYESTSNRIDATESQRAAESATVSAQQRQDRASRRTINRQQNHASTHASTHASHNTQGSHVLLRRSLRLNANLAQHSRDHAIEVEVFFDEDQASSSESSYSSGEEDEESLASTESSDESVHSMLGGGDGWFFDAGNVDGIYDIEDEVGAQVIDNIIDEADEADAVDYIEKTKQERMRKATISIPKTLSDIQPHVLATLETKFKHLASSFNCPITCSPMKFPVVASDGHTYELEGILKWFCSVQSSDEADSGSTYASLRKLTSPVTNMRLSTPKLVPNYQMRAMMQQLYSVAQQADEFYNTGITGRDGS